MTSAVTGRRSNQLNYQAIFAVMLLCATENELYHTFWYLSIPSKPNRKLFFIKLQQFLTLLKPAFPKNTEDKQPTY